MLKQLFFSFLTAAIFLIGCQPPVAFDTPQPADINPLGGFPKRIQGKYLSSEDSSFLQITASSMLRTYDFYLKIHLSQLDSTQQIIGDTLFDLKTNMGKPIQIEGDSIVTHIFGVDTLFTIDKLNVLKKYKGYYFVNNYTPPDTWQVKKLELSRGKLILSSINNKEDLEQLKELTESTQDTVPYVFSVSHKQFKAFVHDQGFRDIEIFIRIRD